MKKVQSTIVIVVSNESSVDKEPLIKRMRKTNPTTTVYEKVGESVVVAAVTKKVIDIEEVASENGTSKKVVEVRLKEETKEANVFDTSEKVASSPVREDEASNPTCQIRGVLDDLQRDELEELFTPLRALVNFDVECALAVQLKEQEHLMGIDEVVGSFVNESNVETECKCVHTWRNWRASHLEEIKNKLPEMWDEKLFSLQ